MDQNKQMPGQGNVADGLLNKKEQTTKKIEYISSYVEKWLYVWVHRKDEIQDIVFIDGMCNNGIYADGDYGTSAKVAQLFCNFATEHRSVHFHLLINDLDEHAIERCYSICNSIIERSKCENIDLRSSNMDINDYLESLTQQREILGNFGTATLLFVDPFNAGTVRIGALQSFLRTYYCELFFNWFSSDQVRNKDDERIINCFGGLSVSEEEDASRVIRDALKVRRIKYVFGYAFRNSKNSELYQIIYATPSNKGLEKLKEVLWEVFGGKEYHRNNTLDPAQKSLFSDEMQLVMGAEQYGLEAQRKLCDAFAGEENVPFEQIAVYLLENTLLKESQLLDYAVKPLLESGQLIKCGKVNRKNNFKKDVYTFLNEKRC